MLLDSLLDLLFPPRCVGCQRRGALLCLRCRATCRRVPAAANAQQHARLASPYLRSTAGAYIFEGAVREAIHTLKYNRRVRVAAPLGELLAHYLIDQAIQIDAIVPVPLHADRQRKRGFNQSMLLAQQLAVRTKLPVLTTELKRIRHTAQQADLNREQRRANVVGAFMWQGSTPPPRRVLILDDVLTTGATVESAAQALCRAGAVEVHALALARGL